MNHFKSAIIMFFLMLACASSAKSLDKQYGKFELVIGAMQIKIPMHLDHQSINVHATDPVSGISFINLQGGALDRYGKPNNEIFAGDTLTVRAFRSIGKPSSEDFAAFLQKEKVFLVGMEAIQIKNSVERIPLHHMNEMEILWRNSEKDPGVLLHVCMLGGKKENLYFLSSDFEDIDFVSSGTNLFLCFYKQ